MDKKAKIATIAMLLITAVSIYLALSSFVIGEEGDPCWDDSDCDAGEWCEFYSAEEGMCVSSGTGNETNETIEWGNECTSDLDCPNYPYQYCYYGYCEDY